MLQKTIKWSLVLAIAGGLASCMMDNDARHAPMPYEQQAPAKHVKGTKTVAKAGHSSATDPVQKTTPGPKRAAAPQLPVIQ